jgi:hypothetical protein
VQIYLLQSLRLIYAWIFLNLHSKSAIYSIDSVGFSLLYFVKNEFYYFVNCHRNDNGSIRWKMRFNLQ